MTIALYILGAILMMELSKLKVPDAETWLHFMSGVVWPFIVVALVLFGILGIKREDLL